MSIRSFLPTFRRARPENAPAISRLYYEAYRPLNGGEPKNCYPFPQFLQPGWVEDALKTELIRWFVAEYDHELIGTCGAVVNIGTEDDRVAECFGLVIDEKWRFQRLGSELFERLCDCLTATDDAKFVIAEVRTSHPGGWKVTRYCNFVPLGFEPYAHAMPGGSESMLLTGKIMPVALEKRDIESKTSANVYRLSEPVLGKLSCGTLCLQTEEASYSLSPRVAVAQIRLLDDAACVGIPRARREAYDIKIVEDNSARSPPERLKKLSPHKAGVISLQRLEGEDAEGIRYRRRYFLASLNDRFVGYALVVYDCLDQRLRILDLRTLFDGIQGVMIHDILRKVVPEVAFGPLTVVLDVRADNVRLHGTLEKLGFFPTVYYPALISEGRCRVDAVQFTRLYNLDFEKSRNSADFSEWPLAGAVVSRIFSH